MDAIDISKINRNLLGDIQDAMKERPVILLQGARQTGKSTLSKMLGSRMQYVSLDNAAILRAAKADPDGWIADFETPVVIDEVQHAPELFRSIKIQVDERRRPGHFFLTGSAQVLMMPKLSESLAGRMAIFTLYPFSQGELAGRKERFLTEAFSGKSPDFPSRIPNDWIKRACLGGFPEALKLSGPKSRLQWYTDYMDTILLRDVQSLSEIEGIRELPNLMHVMAARAGGLLNITDIARTLKIPQTTLARYLALLEMTFFVHTLPAWHTRSGQNLAKMPKVYLGDTGLLSSLLGFTPDRLTTDGMSRGALLENFVYLELVKQMGYSDIPCRITNYRTHAQQEVDFVLEANDGRVIGIEVKAGQNIGPSDLSGMRRLAEDCGDKFVRGIVLYSGETILPLGPKLTAWPIGTLWS